MSENQEFRQYYRLSSEDKRTYNRWLWVNAVFAVIVFTGLLAMAVAGAWVPRNGPMHRQAEQALLGEGR